MFAISFLLWVIGSYILHYILPKEEDLLVISHFCWSFFSLACPLVWRGWDLIRKGWCHLCPCTNQDSLTTVGLCFSHCQSNLIKPHPHSPDRADQELLSIKGKVLTVWEMLSFDFSPRVRWENCLYARHEAIASRRLTQLSIKENYPTCWTIPLNSE